MSHDGVLFASLHNSAFSEDTLVTWRRSWWTYLHLGSQHTVQVRAGFVVLLIVQTSVCKPFL